MSTSMRITFVATALAVALATGTSPAGGTSRTLRLVAIGDSLPYGQADCGNCATFVDLFGKAIARATGARVVVKNLSEHTGINSTDLRRELGTRAALREAVRSADAITLTIGHNDQPWNRADDVCDGRADPPKWEQFDADCVAPTAAVYGRNLESILRTIRSLRGGKPTLLRVTNDYNDIIGDPTTPKSFYVASKPFYEVYTALTCRLARTYQAICIDTYHAFNGPDGTRDARSLLAGYHTHPNPKGHRLIASLLIRAGFKPLH